MAIFTSKWPMSNDSNGEVKNVKELKIAEDLKIVKEVK